VTGFAAKLAAVEEAVRELRTTEDAVEDARARFRSTLREAHGAGSA
jgi:hypothetical protein